MQTVFSLLSKRGEELALFQGEGKEQKFRFISHFAFSLKMDAYVQNPQLLNGKPKETVASYVEQNGILVPRRFCSLEEAVQSGKPFIVRSEHQDEYSGPSGLLSSVIVDEWHLNNSREWHQRRLQYGHTEVDIRKIDAASLRSTDLEKGFFPEDALRLQTGIGQQDFEEQYRCWQKSEYIVKEYCRLMKKEQDAFSKEIGVSYWEFL